MISNNFFNCLYLTTKKNFQKIFKKIFKKISKKFKKKFNYEKRVCSDPCFLKQWILHYLSINFNFKQFFQLLIFNNQKKFSKNFQKNFQKNFKKIKKKFNYEKRVCSDPCFLKQRILHHLLINFNFKQFFLKFFIFYYLWNFQKKLKYNSLYLTTKKITQRF